MARNRTLNFHTLRAFILFSAVLTFLIACSVVAQVAGTHGPIRRLSTNSATPPDASPDSPNRLTILYNFTGGNDGGTPGSGGLVYLNGNFYGTTLYGGESDGIVYQLSNPQNNSWIETPILTLCEEPSCNPYYAAQPAGGLTADRFGNLYGTSLQTYGGGGTLFELTLSNGVWSPAWLATLVSTPLAAVVFDIEGNLYGTISQGGTLTFVLPRVVAASTNIRPVGNIRRCMTLLALMTQVTERIPALP